VANKTVCPDFGGQIAKFTTNTANSLLCAWQDTASNQLWSAASDICRINFGGAHLCSYEELHRACATNGNFVPAPNAWLNERNGDDGAIITNGGDCANFDGQPINTINNTRPNRYCCFEWPKY
jgi:hypothetical protein